MKNHIRIILFSLPIFLFGVFGWAISSKADTHTAASCSQANIQSAIDAAADEDIVSIPAGSCVWTTGVSWANKNISVVGAGIGNTIITVPTSGRVFAITDNLKSSFRISGMTLQGTARDMLIAIDSTLTDSAVKGWRIDHIRFNLALSNWLFYITGINWGLIDNCIFDSADNTGYAIVTIASWVGSDYAPGGTGNEPADMTGKGGRSWEYPLNLGSDEAVYMEDCTINFKNPGSANYPIVDQDYGGGRFVFRHNTVKAAYIENHPTRTSARGGMKNEIYNNTFVGDGLYRWAAIRSGTGVVFNNTVSGYQVNSYDFYYDRSIAGQVNGPIYNMCDGTQSWDGNIEPTGWPCLDQIGRAPKAGTIGYPASNQESVPYYGWNNGSTASCASGGVCNNSVTLNNSVANDNVQATPHSNGQVDYVNNGSTPKPGYAPYIYPHSLAVNGSPSPAPTPTPTPPADTTPPAAPSGLAIN